MSMTQSADVCYGVCNCECIGVRFWNFECFLFVFLFVSVLVFVIVFVLGILFVIVFVSLFVFVNF